MLLVLKGLYPAPTLARPLLYLCRRKIYLPRQLARTMTYSLDSLPPTPTPKDYHRIHFDTSALPVKRIVGLLACQRECLVNHLFLVCAFALPSERVYP
jgi:hypothetical protein